MMNIKLRKDFENLEDGEECLIYIECGNGFKFFEIGWWYKVTPTESEFDVEGEGEGFYSEELDVWDDLVFKKQEKVLGFINLKDVEVE